MAWRTRDWSQPAGLLQPSMSSSRRGWEWGGSGQGLGDWLNTTISEGGRAGQQGEKDIEDMGVLGRHE